MKYVSRRYLNEKWDKLKWDMENVIGVNKDGGDNVAEDSERVKYEIKEFMDAIWNEIN